ncbi:YhjD/YihY/BrkB family envelope integrity protein [Modestobacter italicus]|uniref:YhjD/YihY/BrkB family envelope integrity protein n=1 Tax=Modestobacter italicus (strain DSM 44449 / CECT 9708 / BC 501) TaxID=2732864 RepID=UPI001C95E11E|nr:YhjD/YihY/BrkB family envelope integrity protein [Modestobacter italicus]
MSAVDVVPELAVHRTHPLTAPAVWRVIRHEGLGSLTVRSFARLRHGDGFSHARATGFQVSLAVVPLVIAVIGLSQLLGASWMGLVLRRTLLQLTPGASDALVRQTLPGSDESALRVSAFVLVVAAALLALTTAMAQLERGANRVYGIDTDRPTRGRYGRALVLAVAAGLPAMAGSLVLVAGSAFAEAVEQVHGIDDDLVLLLTWPVGVLLVVGPVTVLLRSAPHRRQPGWTVLLFGGGLALLAWTGLTLLLAGALQLSAGFGSVYGPLTGVVVLLLWSQMASAAILFGFAVSAELELVAGATPDPSRPSPPEEHR